MNLQENINRIKTIIERNSQKSIHEISNELYNKIQNEHFNDRIIMSNNDKIFFNPVEKQTEDGTKPKGLWYGIGSSWIDWVRNEMPDWEADNVFKININEDKILKITSTEELLDFNRKYGVKSNFYNNINWDKVSKDYSGIEISPYQYKLRLNRDVFWYYGWDVASGCIWGDNTIINVEKL